MHATRSIPLLLLLLICASCLAGESRILYRRAMAPEPEPSLTVRKIASARPETLPSPLSLTAPDGTGLTLASLELRGVVEGPLALTEYHMDFVNAEARTIEGRFEITLPPGAEISRFAMRVGKTWQEAEVVERQRARQVYEAILHQGLDPALLEQDAGNRFRARVFPIGPNETKQLIVSYTQEIAGDAVYSLPLRGLPKIPEISVRIDGPGTEPLLERVFEDHRATEDLVVPLEPSAKAFVNGALAVAKFVPVSAKVASREQDLDSLTLLVDTSASRAAGYLGKLDRLAAFCDALREQSAADPAIELIAFDQTSERIYRGPLSGLDARAFERLAERQALGATDLAAAIDGLRSGKGQRLILATDGVPTLGDREASVATLTRALANKGFTRIDVLVDGSLRDQQVLGLLVSEGLRSAGQVIELERERPAVAAARVRRATLAPISVTVPGASWASPRELRGLQPGDEVLVFAELDELAATFDVELRTAGAEVQTLRLETEAIGRPLLERSVVSHRVREQLAVIEAEAEQDPEQAGVLARELTELATEHRMLTPFTAMLVLEDQGAYDRFGLSRDALAPILGIEAGEAVLRHGRDELAKLEKAPAPERDETRSALEEVIAETPSTARASSRSGADEIIVEAPVSEASATVTMEDAKALPVGDGTSRDFTAVVDLAPTANRDAAGISLAGTTGAETRYAVEGANIRYRYRYQQRSPRYAEVVGRRVTSSDNYDGRTLELALALLDAAAQRCYEAALNYEDPWEGRASLRLIVGGSGQVDELWMKGAEGHPEFEACVIERLRRGDFAATSDGRPASLDRRYVFRPGLAHDYELSFAEASDPREVAISDPALTGRYAEVLALLDAGAKAEALELAQIWHELSPGDPLALVGLGKALEASGEHVDAARAYAGLVDLHPSRADIRRYAGNLLESLAEPALDLAIDSYERAIAARPDQPSTYRMLAFAQARGGDYEAALATLEDALVRRLPRNRGVHELLLLDMELLAGVWVAADPGARKQVLRRVVAAGGKSLDTGPSIRFVLSWETDANDVDLHVEDRAGNHAYYERPELRTGGRLLADVTTGFGPEGFVIPEPKAFPYSLRVNYFNRGSSGHGMGQVQVIRHDGQGRLDIENRPFVLMLDHAELALGVVEREASSRPGR